MKSGAGRILTVRSWQTNYFFFHRHAAGEKAAAGNEGNVLVLNFDDVMNEGEKKFTKL
jgi:hypothetical protein